MKEQLLETIRCEDGNLQNLEWHQERVERSSRALFGPNSSIDIQHIKVPPGAREGLFKCRLLYGAARIQKVEFSPYAVRPVKKLRLIQAGGLEYQHKYAVRSKIQALFGQRGEADDILMIKNGFITDTSYANIALFDGGRWHTPATPLLPGTRRAALLAAGRLTPADIPPQRLSEFREIRLINAMMGLEEGPRLLPEDIFI